MKTQSTKTNRTKSQLMTAAIAALFAVVSIAVSAQPPVLDESEKINIEPLAGRDFSMRLDLAHGRFERYDGQVNVVESVSVNSNCIPTAISGLWLAVSDESTRGVNLLPLGTTQGTPTTLSSDTACDTASVTLPRAVLARISAIGGGVIYIDTSTLPLDVNQGLAGRVP